MSDTKSNMIAGFFCPPAPKLDPAQCEMSSATKLSFAKIGRYCCNFCKQNGEPIGRYTSHRLRDANGIVECPTLREYTCSFCSETGDNSHTNSYCPWVKQYKSFVEDLEGDKKVFGNMGELRKTQFSAAGQRFDNKRFKQ